MSGSGLLRIGVLGAARITERALIQPARALSAVTVTAVAARDPARADEFALQHGIPVTHPSYDALLADPDVDAVYVPLPNSLHAEWTIAALRAGKPVLCEKPLCGNFADTERVLSVARQTTGSLLWEAFVFPFHAQMALVREAVDSGAIGEPREIQSSFHFMVSRPDNIRFSADLQGGALNDVGCYPIRLAFELFGCEHETSWAKAVSGGQGVDVESWGSLGYPGDRRLMLSCGLGRSYDTFTRLLGTGGEIRISNPFHPSAGDHFQILGRNIDAQPVQVGDEPSFAAAIRHIQAVLRGQEEPRLLALDTAMPIARALHDLHACLGRSDSD